MRTNRVSSSNPKKCTITVVITRPVAIASCRMIRIAASVIWGVSQLCNANTIFLGRIDLPVLAASTGLDAWRCCFFFTPTSHVIRGDAEEIKRAAQAVIDHFFQALWLRIESWDGRGDDA